MRIPLRLIPSLPTTPAASVQGIQEQVRPREKTQPSKPCDTSFEKCRELSEREHQYQMDERRENRFDRRQRFAEWGFVLLLIVIMGLAVTGHEWVAAALGGSGVLRYTIHTTRGEAIATGDEAVPSDQ